MKNNKSKKKYLLTAGLGLGAVATIVPLTLTATSCSTSESFDYKAIIGRNVKWTDKEDKKHGGTLIKVDGNKIWVDKFDGTNITSSNIEEFTLPLESDDFSYDGDKSMSKEEVVAELTDVKTETIAFVDVAYTSTKTAIESFIEGETNEEAKSIANDMLTIFIDKMTTLTVGKMDEIIEELNQNNSLKKLDEIINYYGNTFVWSRDEFFTKYNELFKIVNEQSQQSVSRILGNVVDICGVWQGFTNVLSTLKISK